jgi:hypothetical protein
MLVSDVDVVWRFIYSKLADRKGNEVMPAKNNTVE